MEKSTDIAVDIAVDSTYSKHDPNNFMCIHILRVVQSSKDQDAGLKDVVGKKKNKIQIEKSPWKLWECTSTGAKLLQFKSNSSTDLKN